MFEGEVVLQCPARRYLEKLSVNDRERIINALQILLLSDGSIQKMERVP